MNGVGDNMDRIEVRSGKMSGWVFNSLSK